MTINTGTWWRFWPVGFESEYVFSVRAATHLSAWDQPFAEHRGSVFFWGAGHPKNLKATGNWPPRCRRIEKKAPKADHLPDTGR